MDNNENKEPEEQKITLSSKTSEEDKKIIEDTYSFYTSQTVKIEEEKPVIKKKVTAPLVKKVTGKLPELDISEIPLPKEYTQPQQKIVYKEINSLKSLNSNLQDKVKSAMNGANAEKIKDALKEIEKSQDNFFTQEGKVFDDLSKTEMQTVEKKIAEMKVAKEITEINVSAIISCIDNLKTKKK